MFEWERRKDKSAWESNNSRTALNRESQTKYVLHNWVLDSTVQPTEPSKVYRNACKRKGTDVSLSHVLRNYKETETNTWFDGAKSPESFCAPTLPRDLYENHWLEHSLDHLPSFQEVKKFLDHFLRLVLPSPVCQQAHLAKNLRIHEHPTKPEWKDKNIYFTINNKTFIHINDIFVWILKYLGNKKDKMKETSSWTVQQKDLATIQQGMNLYTKRKGVSLLYHINKFE